MGLDEADALSKKAGVQSDTYMEMNLRHKAVSLSCIIACLWICLAGNRPAASCGPSARFSFAAQDSLQNRLQERLELLHSQGRFPGATAGFAFADGSSLGIAAGVSDRETGAAMSPASLMLQGSVGKTYVSAVALQLVAEGKIKLDDPISRWLAEENWFSRLPNSEGVTVRMLMNHSSGLVRYEFNERFTGDLTRNPYRTWKPEELVSYILDTRPPFAPGQGWTYSDTNYIVLGMIIERITQSTWYEQLARRILEPLKLRHTFPSDRPVIPGLSQGYAGANNPFGGSDAMIRGGRFAINPQFEWTGGGIASTAEDLAVWAKALYEGRAFPPSMLDELLKGVPAQQLGRSAKYGLGVIIRPTPMGDTYGHSGFFPGYVTEMMYFPQHKLAIAVQVNTSVGRATGKPLTGFITDFAEIIVSSHTPSLHPTASRR